MEIKRVYKMAALLGVGCIFIAALVCFSGYVESPFHIFALPFEGVGKALRWLSLSSFIGNVFAWIAYIILSLIPVAYFFMKYKAKYTILKPRQNQIEVGFKNEIITGDNVPQKIKAYDFILIGISIYLFYMLYCFINPSQIVAMLPSLNVQGNEEMGLNFGGTVAGSMNENSGMVAMMKLVLTFGFYSILIGYVVLVAVDNYKTCDMWKRIKQVLYVSMAMHIVYVCCFVVFSLLVKLNKSERYELNYLLILFDGLVEILPLIMFIVAMGKGIELLATLSENRYGENGIVLARELSCTCKNAVITWVLCNIAGNVAHIVLASYVMNINIAIGIPFVSLIVTLAALVGAEYLKSGAELTEDNNMII